MNFSGKTIAIGICGGIAAYKACDLIRELYRQGAERVIPLMTQSAEAFITPLTLQSLSQEKVLRWDASIDEAGIPVHITLAQQADALLILPATVNTIAKLAHGLADDLLSTTFMTFTDKPVVLAPAMNTRMWRHPIFQENLQKLDNLPNLHVIDPSAGLLACGETGEGHLASQDLILQALYRALHPQAGLYQNCRALVTAGGTAEPIDPVRAITNQSSGKMGLALADELWAMGASVTLLSSRPVDRPYPVLSFTTASELGLLLDQHFPDCDLLMMAAAVSDFKVANPASQKIKKDVGLNFEMALNEDLLAQVSEHKQPHQMVVGFAAESEHLLKNAITKLAKKHLDAIVANDISRSDIGFQSDENEVTILMADGFKKHLPRASKADIARQILCVLRPVAIDHQFPGSQSRQHLFSEVAG